MSSRPFSTTLKTLAGLACVLVIAGGAGLFWFYQQLQGSKPHLEGRYGLSGLKAEVKVERDALGAPSLHAKNRLDAAQALGWLHAQDRFFQMDLLRRRAAGELAELLGQKALPLDEANRWHEFRRRAEESFAQLPANQKALAEAYSEGVNAGLAALASPPWEYSLLRVAPQAWKPSDCILVGFSMVLELHRPGLYEASLATLRDVQGDAATNYFAPLMGPEDAALDDSKAPLGRAPSARELDLRIKPSSDHLYGNIPASSSPSAPKALAALEESFSLLAGSNAFAVSGAFTQHGGALLANDMHLSFGVPNIWYRAAQYFPDPVTGKQLRLIGMTLPGSPLLIAGSNGSVAWGMTNSFADTSDLVLLDMDPMDPKAYRYRDAFIRLEKREYKIAVKGADPVTLTRTWSAYGPVVFTKDDKRPYALLWTAYLPGAIDFSFDAIVSAQNVLQALATAQRSGLPSLNFVCADLQGEIAYTLAGPLPKRLGFSGRQPISHAYADRRWDGFLEPSQHPSVIAPASGYFSSANERLFSGADLEKMGDGGYEQAYRARQLRDDLGSLVKTASKSLTPEDLLKVQLDDRALFLASWRDFLLKFLTPERLKNRSDRADFRQFLEKWSGKAATDSVGYRLVRAYRDAVLRKTLYPIFESCVAEQGDFSWSHFHYEPALKHLLETQPIHLLPLEYRSWDQLLISTIDEVIENHKPLKKATWGERNTAKIQHPLVRGLPGFLAERLSMPALPLAGDNHMPRVCTPGAGASERLVVEPGREEEGIFHMPGGQSAHPLSPYFKAGYEDWVSGKATPLLPGPTQHTLTLAPTKPSS